MRIHGSLLDAGEQPARGSFCIVAGLNSVQHARPWQLDLAAAAILVAGAAAGSPAVLLLLGESEGVGGHASRPHAAAAVRWRRRVRPGFGTNALPTMSDDRKR